MDTGSGHDPGTGTGGGTPGRGDGSPSPPTPPVAGGAWAPPREPIPRSLVTARITAVAAWVLLGTPSAVLVCFLLLALTFVQGLSAPWGTEDAVARIESRIVVVALLGLAAAGASGGVLGALLIVLPAVSLPSAIMVGRALGWKATAATAGAAVVAGLLAGGILSAVG